MFTSKHRNRLHHLDRNEKLLEVFAYSSNNRVFYGPKLNLKNRVGHQISTYATSGRESPKICTPAYKGRERYTLCLGGHLDYLFFWQHVCLMVYCITFRNLILTLFKQGVFVTDSYFSPMRSVSVAITQTGFFTLN